MILLVAVKWQIGSGMGLRGTWSGIVVDCPHPFHQTPALTGRQKRRDCGILWFIRECGLLDEKLIGYVMSSAKIKR